MTWSIELTPWPFRSQLTSPTADGNPDENRLDDCGPTCLAMVIEYLTGVRIDPDTIKDQILGQGVTGVTTPQQLADYLQTYASTEATVLNAAPPFYDIWSWTVQGEPLIALKQFSPTVNSLHWVVVIGLDPSTVTYADPWTGTKAVVSRDEFAALYRGVLIPINRTRDTSL